MKDIETYKVLNLVLLYTKRQKYLILFMKNSELKIRYNLSCFIQYNMILVYR